MKAMRFLLLATALVAGAPAMAQPGPPVGPGSAALKAAQTEAARAAAAEGANATAIANETAARQGLAASNATAIANEAAARQGLAASSVPVSAFNWDGSTLTYAVQNGPRVCVLITAACPSLLPNASATVPTNSIADGMGGHLFDPVSGQFFTLN